MNRDESIELWQQGKDAWNAWANIMLAEREVLEQDGLWQVYDHGIPKGFQGQNSETREWIQKANVNFSCSCFRPQIWPGGKSNGGKQIVPKQDYVNFSGFIFPYHANFNDSIFDCSYTQFHKAQFIGGYANFADTQFIGADVAFTRTQFIGGYAYFGGAQFSGGNVLFNSAKFDHDAFFSVAQFEKPVNFSEATFKKSADFSSITSEKSFNLTDTKFAQVPGFTETAFHAPPVLDDIKIADPLECRMWNWRGKNEPRHGGMSPFKIANAPTDSRKYRALSKMADEAKDYQNEMEFFAREQRCRRFWNDRPFGKGAGRFWFGLAYEKFSDFGRSFLRPFIGWLATLAIFTSYYWSQAKGTGHIWDSLYLSLRHGLVISGLTKNGHMTTLLTKMYCTDIPAFAFMLQPFISAIWIFLLLLALRNQFKIR